MPRRGELGDLSPLTGPKSLEDEEQDEDERKVFEQTEPRRDDDPFSVDPRDPNKVIWRAV